MKEALFIFLGIGLSSIVWYSYVLELKGYISDLKMHVQYLSKGGRDAQSNS